MALTAPMMWVDGAMVSSSDATLPLLAHATQRGSLVFDLGSFNATARGPALFRPQDHVARFLRSCRVVGLQIEPDADALLTAAVKVVATSGEQHGWVRWCAFFAAAQPDLLPRSSRAQVAVAVQTPEDPPRQKPLRVGTFDDARKAAPEALDPGVKAAAAYLGPMLARRRAQAAGYDDVVLIDCEGNIAEPPVANVFAVVDGALWTPPSRYVLPGITRQSVLELGRYEGLEVREEPLSQQSFASADEVFFSGTQLPIAAVESVNGKAVKQAPGPITERIRHRLSQVQAGEDPAFRHWLLPV